MPTDATRAKELAGLIARVEAATGPDRSLDAAIAAFACGGKPTLYQDVFPGTYWSENRGHCVSANVTASIDAAVALVKRMLPGIFWVIGEGKTHSVEKLFGCQLLFGTEEIIGSGESDHAPLAILLAMLKAIHALAGEDVQG